MFNVLDSPRITRRFFNIGMRYSCTKVSLEKEFSGNFPTLLSIIGT